VSSCASSRTRSWTLITHILRLIVTAASPSTNQPTVANACPPSCCSRGYCRVPLRRGMAFSTSTKNPPLRKTRNITSQNSINWHQIPATPTPPSPRSQHQSPGVVCMQKSLPLLVPNEEGQGQGQPLPPPPLHKQLSHQAPLPTSNHNQSSTETDVWWGWACRGVKPQNVLTNRSVTNYPELSLIKIHLENRLWFAVLQLVEIYLP